MNTLTKLIFPIALIAITAGATNALGSTLTMIPPLSGDTDNEGRTVTPDGQYVVGLSGTRGFLYPIGSADAINVLSSDSAQATVANGVGYRTSGANTELLVAGLTTSGPAEFMTLDGGTNWGVKRRNTALGANTMGTANQLGCTTASDVYYVSSSRNASGQAIYLSEISGTWGSWTIDEANKGLTSPDRGIMYGVSSIGRAVGRRGAGSSTYGAYVLDFATGTPTAYYINTLNDGQNGGVTTQGELWSVSNDGDTMFGRSWLTGTSGDYHAFKTTLSGFGPGAQGAVNQLPEYPDTSVSVVPYGASADGRYAVGMDYRGVEKAVLWDTGDPNPANWTVTDLTDLATSEGILGGFTVLTRAYSIGVDGSGNLVITGWGSYFDGAATYKRGFVMTISSGTAPAPQPIITSTTGAGTGSVTVNYTNTVAGTNYTLQYNTNLNTGNWYDVGTAPAGGTSASQTDATAIPGERQRYYRVRTP